jgi:CBS domain-containing protein
VYEFLHWQARDVMSKPVTIPPTTTLGDAQRFFEQYGFDVFPVVDPEERLLGVVSSLDLLAAFTFSPEVTLPPYSKLMQEPVSRVMSRRVSTVTPRTPLTRVLERLVRERRKSLPVIDDDRVVGVVAREDLMTALRRAEQDGELPGAPGGGT